MPRIERILRWLKVNPSAIAGVVLLAAGLVLSLAATVPRGNDPTSPLGRAMSGVLWLVQEIVLWGDETIAASQPRFNSIYLSVLREELSPEQRQAMDGAQDFLSTVVGAMLSPQGALTLLFLLGGYYIAAHTLRLAVPDRGVQPVDRAPFDQHS